MSIDVDLEEEVLLDWEGRCGGNKPREQDDEDRA